MKILTDKIDLFRIKYYNDLFLNKVHPEIRLIVSENLWGLLGRFCGKLQTIKELGNFEEINK